MNLKNTITCENLENFPFKKFKEFKESLINGKINVMITPGNAFEVTLKCKYTKNWTRKKLLFLSYIPLIGVIFYIIYSLFEEVKLLFFVPIFLIAFFVFHRGLSRFFFGPGFRTFFIWLVLIGFIYSCLAYEKNLAIGTGILLLMWWSEKGVWLLSFKSVNQLLTQHEDLLCGLWLDGTIMIQFENGDTQNVNYKSDKNGNIVEGSCNLYEYIAQPTLNCEHPRISK